MKNQYERCFALSKSESRGVKFEPLYHCHLLPRQDLRNSPLHTRGKFAQDPPRKKRRAWIFHGMCGNKPRQGASRCIRRKLFCKKVIEEDSIFPRRHRGLPSPWLRLQSCGLLSSFFMFSLFDVVFLGGASHSILELARNTVRTTRIILQIFPLFRPRRVVGRAWRRASHSVHVKHKTRRSTCGSVRTD